MRRGQFVNFSFLKRDSTTVTALHKEQLCFLAVVLVILLYISPLLILGEDSHILIHDNLDGQLPLMRVLADEELFFARNDTQMEQVFNGLPRGFLSTELNFILWLFAVLPPFPAYVVNLALLHLIAFAGMYRLLRLHILPDGAPLITIGTALTFSLLPFYPFAGLSVAGLPLALSAFLSIRARHDTWLDWLLIILIPLYSSLVLSFAFLFIGLFLLWFYDLIILRRVGWSFIAAMGLMGGIYLIVEFRLILSAFTEGGVASHREEFAPAVPSFLQILKNGVKIFFLSHYHAFSLHQFVILPTSILALATMWFKKVKEPRLLLLLVIVAIISAWYALWLWATSTQIVIENSLLGSINLSRFHWLLPLIWYLIFALALNIIDRYFQKGQVFVFSLIALQVLFLFSQNDQFQRREEQNKSGPEPTYRQFYAENIFSEIADYIGESQESYRVVSLGMHPSIALYNGFYVLDGYVSNYPLEYKNSFRPIIEQELEKSKRWQEYYDNWGSRVYLFSDELDNAMYLKELDGQVNHLEVNTGAIKELGGEYIFAAVRIMNADEIGLDLVEVFEREDAAWRVHLYHVR